MRRLGLILLTPIVLFSFSGEARVSQEHPGYLESVTEERTEVIQEMVLVVRPEESKKESLKERIFDAKLRREFQIRYEDQFGRTEAERNIFTPNRFEEYEYDTGLSVSFEEDRVQKQRFAEYMMRRLGEHHIDQYFQSNPQVRPIYELKDRISKLDVEVQKGYKLKINYSYSGNYVDLRIDNPYDVLSRVRLQMAEGGIGPSEVRETIVSLRKPLTKTISVGSYFYSESGKISLVSSKSLGPGLSTSLTGTTNYRHSPDTSAGQNLVLVGLSWDQ